MFAYQTKRLILTSARLEHEADLFKLHNDALVREMVFRNAPQTAEDTRERLRGYLAEWRKNGYGWWMVYEKAKDGPIFIGRCGLRDYEDNLEYGNILAKHGIGRGLGQEAARFTITHALRNSTKEKIIGFISRSNSRAQRAAEKLGLRYVDDRFYKYDTGLRHYYEMTRDEYFSQPYHQIQS